MGSGISLNKELIVITISTCLYRLSLRGKYSNQASVNSPLDLVNLKFFTVTSEMANLNEGEIEDLRKRLRKAEKQMKLLQDEILDIKEKLGVSNILPRSSVGQKRNFSTTTSENSGNDNFDGKFLSDAKKLCLYSDNDYIIVYTDGACESNGKFGAKAGIGVWFGDGHPLNISKPVNGRATNNTAEIQACLYAIQAAYNSGITKLKIRTDSQFVINSMTQWIHKWKKNGWRLSTGGDVKNKVDFVKLDEAIGLMEDVKWEYVAGHKGIKGNEEADKLARAGATLYKTLNNK